MVFRQMTVSLWKCLNCIVVSDIMRLPQCPKLWMIWRSVSQLLYIWLRDKRLCCLCRTSCSWCLIFVLYFFFFFPPYVNTLYPVFWRNVLFTDGVETEANGAQLAEVSMRQSYRSWWAYQKWSEGGWTFHILILFYFIVNYSFDPQKTLHAVWNVKQKSFYLFYSVSKYY